MSRKKQQQRGLAFVVAASALAACSVDTSDIHFVPDDALRATAGTSSVVTGNAGAGDDVDNVGGGTTGGQVNVAGVQNKAGTSGKAGANTGGVGAVAGASPVGGGGGVPSGGGGGVPNGGTPGRCGMRLGNPTEPLIDDLDDGDPKLPMFGGREGGWYVSNDGSPLGTQKPPANMPPLPDKPGAPPRTGAAASPAAMHTSGSGFTAWGANMGLTLYQPPGLGACPYDASPHRGVRFWIKSAIRDATVRFVLPTVETHASAQGGTCTKSCGDHYGVDISPVPTVWTQLEIPFAELTQRGFGTAVKFYPSHALNVEWSIGLAEDFDFWVDQVEFY
jgi:hypothetical protein